MARPARAVKVGFDDELWEQGVTRVFEAEARAAAEAARAQLEQEGLRGSQIDRHYDGVGPKGTRLPLCVKVYVPLEGATSERPYGFTVQLVDDGTLAFVAFGRRHPAGAERDVDERAHRQLHGRFPDEEK